MTAFQELRTRVYEANIKLVESGLVVLTWGNASGADRTRGVFAIKPSGVAYSSLKPDDMVIVDIKSGEVVEGDLNPSSDTPTHVILYREFTEVGGVVHTHSTYATGWAQARRGIPCYGTTHADHFYGTVPVTRQLTGAEIESAYEDNSGKVIVERFKHDGLNPLHIPAALLPNHGPFTWGKTVEEAVKNAIALEEVAHMAFITETAQPLVETAPQNQINKHFYRKHGPDAYYGQN
jgi:L-ribulose-5-phosphate 4-epimerase